MKGSGKRVGDRKDLIFGMEAGFNFFCTEKYFQALGGWNRQQQESVTHETCK